MKSSAKLKAVPALLKLNFGAGDRQHEDFEGVDICKLPNVKHVVDLFKFPWPWDSNSVGEVYCQQFFEHVPAKIRFRFMDELYRVMALEGKATFICPYWSSMRAVQDPTHEWPPIAESSFLYFNEGWRRLNHLEHYKVSCNFDFTFGFGVQPMFAQKAEEPRTFACAHNVNSVSDIYVTMTKKARLEKEPHAGRS